MCASVLLSVSFPSSSLIPNRCLSPASQEPYFCSYYTKRCNEEGAYCSVKECCEGAATIEEKLECEQPVNFCALQIQLCDSKSPTSSPTPQGSGQASVALTYTGIPDDHCGFAECCRDLPSFRDVLDKCDPFAYGVSESSLFSHSLRDTLISLLCQQMNMRLTYEWAPSSYCHTAAHCGAPDWNPQYCKLKRCCTESGSSDSRACYEEGLASSGDLATAACVTQQECDERRQELGIASFVIGEYTTKGCFTNIGDLGVAFFGTGGTEEDKATPSKELAGGQERIWCTNKETLTTISAVSTPTGVSASVVESITESATASSDTASAPAGYTHSKAGTEAIQVASETTPSNSASTSSPVPSQTTTKPATTPGMQTDSADDITEPPPPPPSDAVQARLESSSTRVSSAKPSLAAVALVAVLYLS